MLFHLDECILLVVERFANLLERSIKLHPFTIAAYAAVVAVVSFIVWAYGIEHTRALSVLIGFPLVIVALLNLHFTPLMIRDARRRAMQGYGNDLKVDPHFAPVRTMVVALALVIALYGMLMGFAIFIEPFLVAMGMGVFSYFRSCDGLPPAAQPETKVAHA